MPGSTELMIILGVALLLFGPSKLPQLGSAIGESIRNFRKGVKPEEKVLAKTPAKRSDSDFNSSFDSSDSSVS